MQSLVNANDVDIPYKDENQNRDKKDSNIDSPFIHVQSLAFVKFEKNIFQSFTIGAYISANISTANRISRQLLEINLDLFLCGAGQMLNEICEAFQGIIGYYLDSILIKVSPIFYNEDAINVIDVAKAYIPQNNNEEISSNETGFDGQIGTTGLTASISKKYSITKTSNYQIDCNFCANKGVRWSHSATRGGWSGTHKHSVYWYINDNLKGFRVTFMQKLCYDRKSTFFGKIPETINQRPILIHKVIICFNDLTNLNKSFEELAGKLHSNQICMDLKSHNGSPINISNEETNYINFIRTLSLENEKDAKIHYA
ncbi:27675_t:CDS:1 [Dentiscutata erythropus]|uniref:27675_t:CDS:1 n=1 Tax=Dentiscutata erythropus TaxID=1348616 RepID=A0A9N9IDE4_9GLOM|nr:27675_t:CDS:1 [Dentiscutata erythropus]